MTYYFIILKDKNPLIKNSNLKKLDEIVFFLNNNAHTMVASNPVTRDLYNGLMVNRSPHCCPNSIPFIDAGTRGEILDEH